jgi:hypothetical protein
MEVKRDNIYKYYLCGNFMAAVARPMVADLFRWLALKWNGMEGERNEEEKKKKKREEAGRSVLLMGRR